MAEAKTETTQLLDRWHKGDREALESLVERHLPWIKEQVGRRLGGLLRQAANPSDYVQDAMVQFLEYGPRFSVAREAHFRALLLRIVENTIRGKHDWFTARRRELARERPLPSETVLSLDRPRDEVKTPSKSAERHEEEAWVRMGMEFLDPEDRELLIFRQWDKLSWADIGRRLGVSETAARLKHRRVVSRLGEKIWALRTGKFDDLVRPIRR